MKRDALYVASLLLLIAAPAGAARESGLYDVRDYGAKPDGRTLCTQAIQSTIDKCASDGGGTVYLPAGTWLTGTVYLESGISLWLDSGCTLLGSPNKADYGPARKLAGKDGPTFSYWAILAGKNLEHISIRGRGVIDGQGANFKYKNGPRPKNIYLEDCRDVLIEGVRLRDAGSWMQHYRKCRRLTIRDIAVFNHVSYNNDGLNIDSCTDVVIAGCVVDSDDDAIVLKSLSLQPCQNVTISDCIISSHCNSIKMGTESGGGFQNITVSNCTICSPRYSKVIYGRQRGLAGIALEIVDGGTLERVVVSNITIRGVSVPIFMRLGNRARTYEKDQAKPAVGAFRNVIVRDIVATDCSEIGCSITGLPGHPVENVTIANVNLCFDGGGTKADGSREIPEKPDSYPESTMFGRLAAYGFFCRHAKGLEFRNIRLATSAADRRHAVVLDDVEGCVIDSLNAPFALNAAAMIRLNDSRDAFIRHCRPPHGTDVFLDVRGQRTREVLLLANDLIRAENAVSKAPDVPDSAVTVGRVSAQ
ncbi:MAG: glycoside hydrolase family 28 protein [Phycisphaerales bacterium]|nr:MAG: glycoside hydrolase family 28 protein [Phycisphaerales bacterium]